MLGHSNLSCYVSCAMTLRNSPKAADIEILSLLENVASMQSDVLAQYNEWMNGPPVKVAAGQCGWVQRNRFLWLVSRKGAVSSALTPPEDWDWVQPSDSGIAIFGPIKGRSLSRRK